jgi:hypothetical protein
VILGAINDYHQRTSIRFKEYDSSTDRDYIYITGEDSGCWSYVGRLGGVSNTAEGVVKTIPEQRNTPLQFSIFTPHTHTHPLETLKHKNPGQSRVITPAPLSVNIEF